MLKRLKKLISGRPRVDFGSIGRNDLCPCGSGRKFKQCCIDRVARKARAVQDAKLHGSRKG